jgi:hypothetical protein
MKRRMRRKQVDDQFAVVDFFPCSLETGPASNTSQTVMEDG